MFDEENLQRKQSFGIRFLECFGVLNKRRRESWQERSGPTQIHPEPGSETLQR